MTHWIYGHGTAPDDPFVYSVNADGETVIAREGEPEFKTQRQIEDEIAVREAVNDQVLAEWAAALDEGDD